MSGGPSVVGHFSYLVLGGFFRDMNPAWVAGARDLYAHERVEGMLVDTVVAVTHEGAVDIPRDNEDQRASRLSERSFDPSGVEQAERDVQCLTETSVSVVVDFSCVHD